MLATAAFIQDVLANQVRAAFIRIAREMHALDGFPTATLSDGMPKGTTDMTTVEKAAASRDYLESQLATVRGLVHAIDSQARQLSQVCSQVMGEGLPRVEPPQCDGRAFEGAQLPWVPHSRDPLNGWFDPSCEEVADESGLCPRCRVRERRYRQEHDLAPRATNAGTPAAA